MTIDFHHFNSLETKNRAPSRKLLDAEATSWTIVRKENDSTERNGIFLLVSPPWVHQTFGAPTDPPVRTVTPPLSECVCVWGMVLIYSTSEHALAHIHGHFQTFGGPVPCNTFPCNLHRPSCNLPRHRNTHTHVHFDHRVPP